MLTKMKSLLTTLSPTDTIKRWTQRTLMTVLMMMVTGQMLADSYNYVCVPDMGTYTSTGSGTTRGIYINNTNDSYSTTTLANYNNGVIKTTVYGHDTNSGNITFRVKKDDGSTYFVSGTSGKVYIYDKTNEILYNTWFSISNSTTDHVDALIKPGNFSGTRIYQIFMIKSDGQKFYGGSISITGSGVYAPSVSIKGTYNITTTSAQLIGTASANGAATTCRFRYGTDYRLNTYTEGTAIYLDADDNGVEVGQMIGG